MNGSVKQIELHEMLWGKREYEKG